MTQDEIIEMARSVNINRFRVKNLQAFAKLIAAKEREACAKVCDDELKQWGIFDFDVGDVSKAIRARGQANG